MTRFEIVMPKLGESIIEATITRWLKQPGDTIQEDDALVEIATDKVDSEIPSPVEGVLAEVFFKEGDVVPVGTAIAIISLGEDAARAITSSTAPESKAEIAATAAHEPVPGEEEQLKDPDYEPTGGGRFLTPLVKNIAKAEGLTAAELEAIPGTGKDGRLTKQDLLGYLEGGRKLQQPQVQTSMPTATAEKPQPAPVVTGEGDTILEMNRMRRLIADHMVMSKQVSPHVTSFIEVDMTRVVNWREKHKKGFEQREGAKLTFTPIMIEAAARAIRDYPGVNASVDGNRVIIRQKVNIGMATILPDGNLIVPVIHEADRKNLAGLAHTVNDLASRARASKLQPDEIQGGTFTVTNLGSFGSITGTPIINQPQVAILAIGAIRKMPAVVETPEGDMIAIRHKMILALTYDHRVVDGGLGGLYLKRVAEYLEQFDTHRTA